MNNDYYTNWLIKASIGLLTIGAGLSIINDAALRKGRAESWFGSGTLGLVVFNAGVSLLADSVKDRVLHELQAQKGE